MAGLFQVLWGQPDGSFKPSTELKGTDDQPLIIPADEESVIETICTRPSAVDWDADGDLDLVVGNFAGSFYVFTGEGHGRFLPEPQQIMTDNDKSPLKINGFHSDPFPIDWDHDGDIDLISGSSNGGVQWAENVASAGKSPAFVSFRNLIVPGPEIQGDQFVSEAELTGPTRSTRVWVDDVNSDGKLDLLVGDSVMLAARAEGLSQEEFNQKKAEWQKQMNEVSSEYSAAAGNAEKLGAARTKMQELYARRSEFIIEERTGFVWLYLQK
jgi:hypothetical protein